MRLVRFGLVLSIAAYGFAVWYGSSKGWPAINIFFAAAFAVTTVFFAWMEGVRR